ncbi:hypothetical protein SAMN05216278_3314 [Halopelagius longus]|uniref:Uncharacterized protein n=1 Tax=Halopelagius longus TaxID=1236180 RepID=A0A1H1FN20_9EURY|nr:hypothetical protein SAMN05216278_3314 [Halopelagius longus]
MEWRVVHGVFGFVEQVDPVRVDSDADRIAVVEVAGSRYLREQLLIALAESEVNDVERADLFEDTSRSRASRR